MENKVKEYLLIQIAHSALHQSVYPGKEVLGPTTIENIEEFLNRGYSKDFYIKERRDKFLIYTHINTDMVTIFCIDKYPERDDD